MRKNKLHSVFSCLFILLFSACQQPVNNEYKTIYVKEKPISCGDKQFDTLQEACNYAVIKSINTAYGDPVPEITIKTNIKSSSITLTGDTYEYFCINTGYYNITLDDDSVFDIGNNSILLKGDGGSIKANNTATFKGKNDDFLILSGNISLENINLETFAEIIEDEDFCGSVKGNILLSSAVIQVNSKYGWYDIGEFTINKRTDITLPVHSGFYFNVEKAYKDAVKIASVNGDDEVKHPVQYESNLINPENFVSLDSSITGGIHKHNFTEDVTKKITAQNCMSYSVSFYTCNDCETVSTKYEADGSHDIESVELQEVGENSYGIKAHYKCKTCNKLFLDSEGKNSADFSDMFILSDHLTQEQLNDAELKSSLDNLVRLTGTAEDSETRYKVQFTKNFTSYWKYHKYVSFALKGVKLINDASKIVKDSHNWLSSAKAWQSTFASLCTTNAFKNFSKGFMVFSAVVSVVNLVVVATGLNTKQHDAIIEGLKDLNNGITEINNQFEQTEIVSREIELELTKALAKLEVFAAKTEKQPYVKQCNQRATELLKMKDRVNICYDSLMNATDPKEKEEILDMWEKYENNTIYYLKSFYEKRSYSSVSFNTIDCMNETLKYCCAFRNDYYFSLAQAFIDREEILLKAIALDIALMGWYKDKYKNEIDDYKDIATTYSSKAAEYFNGLTQQWLLQNEMDVVYCNITDSYFRNEIEEIEYQITDELNKKYNKDSKQSSIEQVKDFEKTMPTYQILSDGSKRELDAFKKGDKYISSEDSSYVNFDFSPATHEQLRVISAWYDNPADITSIFSKVNGFKDFDKSRIKKDIGYLLDPTASNSMVNIQDAYTTYKKGYVIKTGTVNIPRYKNKSAQLKHDNIRYTDCMFTYYGEDCKHKVPSCCQYFILSQGKMTSNIQVAANE